MMRILLVWLATFPAHGIEAIRHVTETYQGKTVDYELTGTGKYPLKIKDGDQTLTVLDPRFTPRVATDGKNFFELNDNLSAQTKIEIGDGGELKTARLSDGRAVEPGPSVRSQMAAFLINLSRTDRIPYSKGTEAFLIESERLVGDKVFTGGFDAGATVLEGTKRYRVLGKKRYPTLLATENMHYQDPETNAVRPIFFDSEHRLTPTSLPAKKRESVPPATRWAYFNYIADNWKQLPKAQQNSLKAFLQTYLRDQGKGTAVRLDDIVYPDSFRDRPFVDENGKPLSETDVKKRLLNYVLNFIGTNETPKPARESGQGRYDLAPFLPVENLARLMARNPYQCGFDDKAEIRLDWLISTVLNDTFYRELVGMPDTTAELEKQLGIDLTMRPKSKERANSVAPISGVAHVGRVGSVQPQKKKAGLEFFGTYDFAVDEANKLKVKKGDYRKNPHDFNYTGGEFIWAKKNRYPVFALYKSDGGSLAAAPDSLVNDSESKLGPFIRNPASCLHCHREMMRSPEEGTFQDPADWALTEKEYDADAELKKDFPTYKAYKDKVDEYYGPAKSFVDRAEKTREGYLSALKESKAFVAEASDKASAVTLLPDYFRHYNGNLTFSSAARELGATTEELEQIIPPSGRIDTFPEYTVETVSWSDRHMRREQFENVYCELKARLDKLRKERIEKAAQETGH